MEVKSLTLGRSDYEKEWGWSSRNGKWWKAIGWGAGCVWMDGDMIKKNRCGIGARQSWGGAGRGKMEARLEMPAQRYENSCVLSALPEI